MSVDVTIYPLSGVQSRRSDVSDTPVVAYQGHTISSLNWTSLTWAAVTAVATMVDDLQAGVNRASNVWTVGPAGFYLLSARFMGCGIAGGRYVGMRWRRSGVTVLQETDWLDDAASTGGGTLFGCTGVVLANAGDAFALEYCAKSGGSAVWAPSNPLDGESMRLGNVTVLRLGG